MNEDILTQLGQGQPEAPAEEPKEEIKYEEQKKSSGKKIEDDLLNELLMNGDNSKGMITPSEKDRKKANDDEELHEEADPKTKLKGKGEAKPSDKYATKFQEDMLKHPENYEVNTPKGKMSIKEAQEKGYDPVTRRFTRNKPSKKEQDLMNQLNDKDRAAVEKLMDPSQVGLAPADAKAMGLNENSKMIRRPEGEQAAPPMQPEAMPAAGMIPGGEVAIPGGSPQQGAPDIGALLGGNV